MSMTVTPPQVRHRSLLLICLLQGGGCRGIPQAGLFRRIVVQVLSSVSRAIGQRVNQFLLELLQPKGEVLPPYSRQWYPIRTSLFGLVGIAAVLLVASLLGFYLVVLPPQFRIFLVAPIAVLAMLVIWVLPDYHKPPIGMMTKAFFGFTIVAVVWPDYIAFNIPGLPWISMRRLLLAPMILALAISYSISSKFRTELREYLSANPTLGKMLLAFVGIQFLSLTLAPEHTDAVKNFVNYQASWTCVFLVSVFIFQNPRYMDRTIKGLLVCGCIVGLIAFVENHEQKVLWMDHIPSFLGVDPTVLELFTGSRFRDGLFRSKSTFTTPLSYAEYMAMISVICVYFALKARSIFVRAIFIAMDIAILMAISLAQARLGIVGFIIGHGAYGLMWALRRWRADKTSLVGPAFSLAYPAFVVALAIAISSISSLNYRVFGGASTQGSNDAREAQFRKAIPHIAKSPIFGYGPEQGAIVLDFRFGTFRTIDSYFVSILLDYGIVGFLLYYGMIGVTIAFLMRMLLFGENDDSDKAILVAAMLTIFLFTRAVLSQEDNNWLPFLLMGMAVVLLRRHQSMLKGGTPA